MNENQNKDNHTTVNYEIKQREIRVNAKIEISDQILDLTIDTGAQISTLKPSKLFNDTMIDCDRKIPITGIAKKLTLFTLGQVKLKFILMTFHLNTHISNCSK